MLEHERELFDEFKRLESLCRDMFSCQHGVSEYISQMEQVPFFIKNRIPSWDKDYRTLKHLRWLRNQIAHETTATDCNFSDVEQLKDFYSRILNGQDPLAAARRVNQELQSLHRQKPVLMAKDILPSNNKQPQKPAHGFLYIYFIVLLFVIFVIAMLFIFNSYFNGKI